MAITYDVNLLTLARESPLTAWTPTELFEGRMVPAWAVNSIHRLVERGELVREPAGRHRWRYRLAA